MNTQLTPEQLIEIVKQSVSFCDACRKAGKPARGATLQFFTQRIRKLGIDTSHFLGKAAHAGPFQTGVCQKKHWSKLLILREYGRERSEPLRRAYSEYSQENGIEYSCTECKQSAIWNQKPLQLHLDHRNENHFDNQPSNLQWLCPNCHSQKHTATKLI